MNDALIPAVNEEVEGIRHGRLAAQTGGVLAAQAGNLALRYVGAICLARAVGVSLYGSFTLGVTIVTVLGIVASLGVSPGALPFLARARRAGDHGGLRAVARATWVLVASCALPLGLLVFLLGPWIGEAFFHDSELAALLVPLAGFIVLASLCRATTGLVQGLFGAHVQALVEPLLVVAVTVLGLACSWWLDGGVAGAVLATLAGPLAGLAAGLVLVRRAVPGVLSARPGAESLPLTGLLRESWPLMGVACFAFVLTWMDVLLMGVFRSPEEVGVYGACARLAIVVQLLHEGAGPVFMERLATHFVAREQQAVRHLYHTTARWCAWSGASLAAVLILWRGELLSLFGEGFAEGAPLLVVLVLGRLATASTGMCGRMMAVTGRARISLLNMLLMIGCNALLDVLWIPAWGGMGAAAATCVSLVAVRILQTAQVWWIFRLQAITARSLAALPAVGALAALAWWLKGPGTGGPFWPPYAALFGLGCAALMLALGTDPQDRSLLRQLLRPPRR